MSCSSERRKCSNFLRERKANLPFASFSECDLSSLIAGWMQHEKQRSGSPRKNAKKKMCKSHILQQNFSKLVIKYKIMCWCRTDETDQEKTAQSIESIFLCKAVRWVWKSCPQLEIFSDSELMNLMLSWVCFFFCEDSSFLLSIWHRGEIKSLQRADRSCGAKEISLQK